jgi:hypothetical protein
MNGSDQASAAGGTASAAPKLRNKATNAIGGIWCAEHLCVHHRVFPSCAACGQTSRLRTPPDFLDDDAGEAATGEKAEENLSQAAREPVRQMFEPGHIEDSGNDEERNDGQSDGDQKHKDRIDEPQS